MKTYTKEKLAAVLVEHVKWLGGEGGTRADLRGADLRGAYLTGADLRGADLRGAYLRDAYLTGAYLTGADLQSADLQSADLTGAYLRGAYLTGACLTGAYLTGADLRGADLRGAYLRDADLGGRSVCPQVGAFTAFKKVQGGAVLELLIPADAKRVSSLVGRKCRASKAFVVRAVGSPNVEFRSRHNNDFIYRVGGTVETELDEDIRIECARGIHFFMEQAEAEEYE